MMIKMDFFTQVCDIIDGLFVSIFKHLTTNCKKELETINGQYPFEPLKVNIIVCSVVPTKVQLGARRNLGADPLPSA
jgi:aspartyl-tRNA synthetase